MVVGPVVSDRPRRCGGGYYKKRNKDAWCYEKSFDRIDVAFYPEQTCFRRTICNFGTVDGKIREFNLS